MTIIVEDGTAKNDAQSYVDGTYATAYHLALGNTSWADRPDLQESSLVRATQMLDLLYGPKYISRKTTKQQALLFPRLGFYDNNQDFIAGNEIPTAVKNAVCELALEIVTANGTELLVANPAAGIKSVTQKVGDLEESITYSSASNQKTFTEKFSKVELMVSSLIKQPDFGIRL